MKTVENRPMLRRVLLVEDDSHLQFVTRIALENVGRFTVKTCSSGSEAVQEALTFLPDLILLDVMMPGMDGPSTLRVLSNFPDTARIPVVFMSAKVQTHEVLQYREMGAVDVISKPFDPMTLSTRLHKIWSDFQNKK